MKFKSLLTILVCLIITTVAQSVDAVLGQPVQLIKEDIRDNLVVGMTMRLPTQDAVDSVQDALYASVERTDVGEVIVRLSSRPSCTARSCARGYFSSTLVGTEHPAEVAAREIGRAQITLAEDIVGHYVTVKGVPHPYSFVLWEQDGQTYVVNVATKHSPNLPGLTGYESARQREIDFAISIASEPPLVK